MLTFDEVERMRHRTPELIRDPHRQTGCAKDRGTSKSTGSQRIHVYTPGSFGRPRPVAPGETDCASGIHVIRGDTRRK